MNFFDTTNPIDNYIVYNDSRRPFDNQLTLRVKNIVIKTSEDDEITMNYMDMTELESLTILTEVKAKYVNFGNCHKLTSLDLSSVKCSNNHIEIFAGCTNLKSIKLPSDFLTPESHNMYGWFKSASSLKTLNLSSFDTSDVVKFADMFRGCKSLETLNISNWDMRNARDSQHMISECPSLKKLIACNISAPLYLYSGTFEFVEAPEEIIMTDSSPAFVTSICESLNNLNKGVTKITYTNSEGEDVVVEYDNTKRTKLI